MKKATIQSGFILLTFEAKRQCQFFYKMLGMEHCIFLQRISIFCAILVENLWVLDGHCYHHEHIGFRAGSPNPQHWKL